MQALHCFIPKSLSAHVETATTSLTWSIFAVMRLFRWPRAPHVSTSFASTFKADATDA